MNKILVIRYGTIGDTIFASAFYRELRKSLPDAKIDVLVDKTAGEVMKCCPYINEIHYIDGKYRHLLKYIFLFKQYDTVYFLKNDNFFSKTAFLAGVKERIGFDVKRNFMLTTKVPYKNDKHEIDFYLDLLKSSGFKINNTNTELWLDNESKKDIDKLQLSKNRKKVLIQAFSRFKQKNWIDEYWVDVVNYLIENGNQVILAGGSGDTDDYNRILSKVNTPSGIINVCGNLSIQESMCLIDRVDLVIGIDSGLIHMAAALNIPSILLNGPTSLTRWKPRSNNCTVLSKNFNCSPCCFASSRNKRCLNKDSECMASIKSEEVIHTIQEKQL